ncbi:hypothetical protein ABZ092_30510 [Streptomyces bobili]|uniref:hypothetical protein n=1 Tax=Streptomyces bobili TaxID=67280 RepID=UPI0033B02371
MSLTVGELNAILSVDDQAVDPALRRAEQALRQAGQRMGRDADRSGHTAGQQLGQGLVRGADGQWRNMSGELVDAVTAAGAEAEARAHRAGQQIGDSLGEGLANSTDAGVAETGTRLGRLKEIAGAAAAAAGAAAGALLVAGMTEALDQGRIVGRLGAQLGKTPKEAQRYGKIAGKLYTDAVTDTFEDGTQAIRHAMQSGLIPPDATNAQIESISRKVADLSNTFEMDLGQTTVAVGQMIRSGMVKNASEGLDLVGKAFQINDQRADDMLDTLKEYPTQFRDLGLNGATALGIMQQGLDGSAKDSDIVADSLKELNIRVKDLSAEDGLKKLKIDAKEASAAFVEGGPKAAEMLDRITDRLRAVKDPTDRFRLSQELLGTQSEDLAGALLDIDPSEASKKMGDFKGTVDRAGDAMRDNAGTKVTQFQRRMQQGVVDFLGAKVIPGMETFRNYVGTKFASVWDKAGEDGEKGADRIAGVALLVAQKLGEKFVEATPKIISAVKGFGGKIAEYVMNDPVGTFKIVAIAGAFLTALVALPALVAAGISALAISLMVGFVGKLISATKSNVPKWWASFTGWVSKKAGEASTWLAVLGTAIGQWFGGLWSKYVTQPVSRTWNSWLGSVRALPGRTTSALSSMGSQLGTTAGQAWQRFKDAGVRKTGEIISYVRGIPGRARSALGNLGGYLYSAGLSLIGGFINGIRAKIGDVRNAASSVLSAARDFFPHSPAKRGPFSGRGYTLYSGHALIDAFGKGIADRVPFVRKQMQGLTEDLSGVVAGEVAVRPSMASLASTSAPEASGLGRGGARSGMAEAPARRVVNNTTHNTYNLTQREMTMQQFEAFQRRQDTIARVGRPR